MPAILHADHVLPTGTVTFLFTDIEGSTKLWEARPETMRRALARHDILLREGIISVNGYVFKTVGDAFCAAFALAPDAVAAALRVQTALAAEPWPETTPIRVRMALHTGAVESRDGDYFGPALNRVARLLPTGYGGQTLLSHTTYELSRDALPDAVSLRDLGAHQLKDLARPEHVYELQHPALRSDFPPLKSLSTHPNNLPEQVTSFIGREKEIADLGTLLARTRVLTLTGSGGSGKTRLGLQVAADALEQYPGGAWFVELAALSDPALVPQAVATALRVKEEPGKPITQTLTAYLKSTKLLLLLDNCEHVLHACARLADALVRECAGVKILATSREALGIAGEQTYHVPSLSLPDRRQAPTPQALSVYESVRLFIDRAQLVRPEFQVTNQNAPALASLCHHLDGIPLAIELAAARVRSLSVEEIDGKLDQRFRLLTSGSRTALPRQQTLRSLIDWSYDLLHEAEKLLLQRLSVFAGGWTLVAAEEVCAGETIERGDVLDLLTSLADKSLVLAEDRNGVTRYSLLETVSQYARDRARECGEERQGRARHLAHFVALAEEAEPQITGAQQQSWLGRLEAEQDNLRSALAWTAEPGGDTAGGLRLAGALWRFWLEQGYRVEGSGWFDTLLAVDPGRQPPAVLAKALDGAGVLATTQGEYQHARSLEEQALAIFRELGDRQGVSDSVDHLATIALLQGNHATARARYEESLALRRDLGDHRGIGFTLNNLGHLASQQANYPAAQALYEQALAIARELHDRRSVGHLLISVGLVAHERGDFAAARKALEEALAIARELGDRQGVALALNNLALPVEQEGDYPSARRLYEDSLAIYRELGDRRGVAQELNNLGTVACNQRDYSAARALLGEALVIRQELGVRPGIAESLTNLAIVAREQGDVRSARAPYLESLPIWQELGNRRGVAKVLEGLAHVAISMGWPDRAARLWGAAERLREESGSPLPPSNRPEYDRERADARAAIGDENAFDHAWQEGRALTLEQAIELATAKIIERE